MEILGTTGCDRYYDSGYGQKMNPVPGHDMEGEEIPEQNVFYRLLKKKYFFGFGAYG